MTADFTAKTGTISNFEIIELAEVTSGTSAASQTIDVDDAFAGVTKFVVSGNNGHTTPATGAEGTFNINDAVSGSTITILTVDPDDTDNDDVTVDLKTDGTADVLNFNIGSATVAASFDALTADDAETVNIVLGSKDGHSVGDLVFADATSVVVTGSGNATVGVINLKDAVSTFDASAATGDLTLTFTDTQNQTIKTGSGKDTVTIADTNVSEYDVFDLGAGADTLKITDIGAAFTPMINGAGVETLVLETASSGSVALDLRQMTGLTTIAIDDAGMTSTVTLDHVTSGTTVQFLDIDDTTAQTHTVTGVVGAAAVTIEVDAVDEGNTIAVNNFTAITLAQKSNTLSGTSAATDLADFNSGDATSLAITSANNALTLRDLSSSKLVSVTISGSTDVAINSGGSTTITSISAAGLDAADNAAELVLGSGALFARAANATITGSDGADTISMSAAAATHAGNVIDAGDNATVDASVKGDNLVMYGSMTGDTVIDLSSTTDQVTSLSGVTNAAVQKGFESFDGSNATMVSTAKYIITGSSGINHIVGDTGADVIDAGAGADIIMAKTGLDVVTTGAGADIVTLSAGDGYVTITDFTVGTGGDAIGFDTGVVTTTGAGAFLAVTTAGAINTGADGVFAVRADYQVH